MANITLHSFEDIPAIFEAHRKWVNGEEGGIRILLCNTNLRGVDLSGANLFRIRLYGADLTGAVLRGTNLADATLCGADLTGADLRYATLTDVILSGANLTDAILTGTDLRYANLTDTILTGADLRDIRNDFFDVLLRAREDVPALLAALREGKINGSTYGGPCACLCGTLEQAKAEREQSGIRESDFCNANRPAERWFLAIRPADTPESNVVAKITEGWIVEFLDQINSAPNCLPS